MTDPACIGTSPVSSSSKSSSPHAPTPPTPFSREGGGEGEEEEGQMEVCYAQRLPQCQAVLPDGAVVGVSC